MGHAVVHLAHNAGPVLGDRYLLHLLDNVTGRRLIAV
jgi:hypothetical protein